MCLTRVFGMCAPAINCRLLQGELEAAHQAAAAEQSLLQISLEAKQRQAGLLREVGGWVACCGAALQPGCQLSAAGLPAAS
jgi:hypothetical protein